MTFLVSAREVEEVTGLGRGVGGAPGPRGRTGLPSDETETQRLQERRKEEERTDTRTSPQTTGFCSDSRQTQEEQGGRRTFGPKGTAEKKWCVTSETGVE